MDSTKKKIEQHIRQSPEPEKKRESRRLTSIIDQLISNKSKNLNNKEAKVNVGGPINATLENGSSGTEVIEQPLNCHKDLEEGAKSDLVEGSSSSVLKNSTGSAINKRSSSTDGGVVETVPAASAAKYLNGSSPRHSRKGKHVSGRIATSLTGAKIRLSSSGSSSSLSPATHSGSTTVVLPGESPTLYGKRKCVTADDALSAESSLPIFGSRKCGANADSLLGESATPSLFFGRKKCVTSDVLRGESPTLFGSRKCATVVGRLTAVSAATAAAAAATTPSLLEVEIKEEKQDDWRIGHRERSPLSPASSSSSSSSSSSAAAASPSSGAAAAAPTTSSTAAAAFPLLLPQPLSLGLAFAVSSSEQQPPPPSGACAAVPPPPPLPVGIPSLEVQEHHQHHSVVVQGGAAAASHRLQSSPIRRSPCVLPPPPPPPPPPLRLPPPPLVSRTGSSSSSGGLIRDLAMPADTLVVVDPAKIKTERLSPPITSFESSSSPSASPSPTAARSPASSTSSARLAGITAASHPKHPSAFPSTPPPPPSPAPTPSTPGFERFSPASLGSCTGTPILKQMEQMMTRNYSDFMRSLAAKYNNSNPSESYSQINGFMRNFDGRFPFKTGTPPLTGLGSKDDGNRKNENHSAPPVLGDQQRASLMNPLRVVDLSSTQALINMMRSASAHSASHLENYLRGTLKRPFGLEAENRADPLDLTVSSANKKLRTTAMDRASLLDPPPPSSSSSALNARFSGVGSAKSMRDFHDLFGSFKSDSEGSDVGSDAAPSPKSIHSTSRLWSSASSSSVLHETLKQPHSPPNGESSSSPSPNKNNNNNNGPNSDNGLQQHPCLSTCGDRACADNAEAGTIAKWTVDDVCKFVAAIDTCAEYAETFREQSIDGAALPLLTEEHLINNMNMKLGPALKFRATLAKSIGHCAVCMHCIHCHGQGSPSVNSVVASSKMDGRMDST